MVLEKIMAITLYLFFWAALITVSRAYPGNVISFTMTPSGPVLAGTLVTFECQAVGSNVFLCVNGDIIHETSNDYEYQHAINMTSNPPYTWNLTLSTFATVQKNNTEIMCHASGIIANQVHIISSNIIVAGPPLPPHLDLETQSNGTILHVMWDEPFSSVGFNITSYNITIHNSSSGYTTTIGGPYLMYNITNPMKNSISCHDLNIMIRAINLVGQSDEGSVSGGFPIIPRISEVIMMVEVVFLVDGSPRITIQFQAPVVCPYQLPADYILTLEDRNGSRVNTSGLKPANTGIIEESFTTGINNNNTYTAKLTISHRQIAWEVTLTKDNIIVPPTIVTTRINWLIIIILSIALTLVMFVVLAIICVSIICVSKKNKRPTTFTERLDLALPHETLPTNEFKLEPPPKGKNPKSLAPMALNPIYDGPTYESPGGESFKSLLGSFSVPTTPMTDSPRYFNPPPTLPPPRKTSISIKPNLPEGIPEEHVHFNCQGNEEYTEMRPVRSRAATLCTVPSPPLEATVPCLPEIPHATYEAMNGEYVSIGGAFNK